MGQEVSMGHTSLRDIATSFIQGEKDVCLDRENVSMITGASDALNNMSSTIVQKIHQRAVKCLIPPPLPTPVRFDLLEKQLDGFDNEKLQLLSAGFRKRF